MRYFTIFTGFYYFDDKLAINKPLIITFSTAGLSKYSLCFCVISATTKLNAECQFTVSASSLNPLDICEIDGTLPVPGTLTEPLCCCPTLSAAQWVAGIYSTTTQVSAPVHWSSCTHSLPYCL